jgi:hypothetical protein
MIGRRPHAAFGNFIGNRQMLEYTQAGAGARLMSGLVTDTSAMRHHWGVGRRVVPVGQGGAHDL